MRNMEKQKNNRRTMGCFMFMCEPAAYGIKHSGMCVLLATNVTIAR